MKVFVFAFAAHTCIAMCLVLIAGILGVVPDAGSVGLAATFILWLALLLPYNRAGQK